MKLKKIIILLLVFILSGCTSDYTLTLNEDSSVNEKAIIEIEDSEENYDKINELVQNAENDNKVSSKDFKVVREVENIKITYNKDYENIEDYLLNSIMYKQVFNDIDLNKKNNKITLETEALFMDKNLSINNDNIYDFNNLQVNITSKLPIIYQNADKMGDNTYTWIYNGKQRSKNISISYKAIPTLISTRSIITLSLIVICIAIIGFVFYRRFNNSNRI